MTKYKVGDVAALFPKPKEPTTNAGKKLQSLFQDFYGKKGKSDFQSNQNKNTENENKEIDSNRKSKKNKRKFSAVDDSEVVSEKTSKKIKQSFNHEEIGLCNSETKKGKKSTIQDFPRKQKKNQKRKSQNFDSNFIKPNIEFSAGHEPESQVASENKNRNKHNKQSLSFIKKSKHQSLKLENNSIGKNNKLSNEEQKDDDTEIRGEIQQIMKIFSKKSEKGDKNFQQNPQKKMFNKKEKTYIPKFESKTEGSFTANDFQNNIVESKAMPEDKKVPDFIRRPKKSLDKNEKFKKDKKKSKGLFGITDNNNNNIDEMSTDTSFFSKKNSEKSKNDKGTIIPDLSSNMSKQPDFIKLPKDTEETSKPKRDDALSRTLFLGNLPVKSSKKALRHLFSRFGEIENIKYNGIETDKAKIFSDKGPKPLNPYYVADSVTGFIVFKERQSAIDALSLRGSLFKGHHITVDFAKPPGGKTIYDKNRSIFIGNLPFVVDDESIWTAFSDCGQIERVRVVRDRETGISKGIGFVLFKTVKAKENALALENVKISDNVIRIKEIESGNKNKNKEVSGESVRKNTFKSKAIRLKKRNENSNSRKSVKKLMKREKNQRSKKQIASILQKAMK